MLRRSCVFVFVLLVLLTTQAFAQGKNNENNLIGGDNIFASFGEEDNRDDFDIGTPSRKRKFEEPSTPSQDSQDVQENFQDTSGPSPQNLLPGRIRADDSFDHERVVVEGICLDVEDYERSESPSGQPSCQPTLQPSVLPSAQPTGFPSAQPSTQPTAQPTMEPSSQPSRQPTGMPSEQPSVQPTAQPTSNPSGQPSAVPTGQPSQRPSSQPTAVPTEQPSAQPTGLPSAQPSGQPTLQPSTGPTGQPTGRPSAQPTCRPTAQPSGRPSGQPTSLPSMQPTSHPSEQPSSQPSSEPSGQPSGRPTMQPSSRPSMQPSDQSSDQPTCSPSEPTLYPTEPSASEQLSSMPSGQPSMVPSGQPTIRPTGIPTQQPSALPSSQPSTLPSSVPSTQPSSAPSAIPDCGDGTYYTYDGENEVFLCHPCPVGFYHSSRTPGSCIESQPGYYAPTGSRNQTICPYNTYGLSENRDHCAHCPWGSVSNEGSRGPSDCHNAITSISCAVFSILLLVIVLRYMVNGSIHRVASHYSAMRVASGASKYRRMSAYVLQLEDCANSNLKLFLGALIYVILIALTAFSYLIGATFRILLIYQQYASFTSTNSEWYIPYTDWILDDNATCQGAQSSVVLMLNISMVFVISAFVSPSHLNHFIDVFLVYVLHNLNYSGQYGLGAVAVLMFSKSSPNCDAAFYGLDSLLATLSIALATAGLQPIIYVVAQVLMPSEGRWSVASQASSDPDVDDTLHTSSYYEMTLMVQDDLVSHFDGIFHWNRYFGRVFVMFISWTIFGQLYSERGRRIWSRVWSNYWVFLRVSLGYWNEQETRDFELKERFDELRYSDLSTSELKTPAMKTEVSVLAKSDKEDENLRLFYTLIAPRAVLLQLIPFFSILSTLVFNAAHSPLVMTNASAVLLPPWWATDNLTALAIEYLKRYDVSLSVVNIALMEVYLFVTRSRAIQFYKTCIYCAIAILFGLSFSGQAVTTVTMFALGFLCVLALVECLPFMCGLLSVIFRESRKEQPIQEKPVDDSSDSDSDWIKTENADEVGEEWIVPEQPPSISEPQPGEVESEVGLLRRSGRNEPAENDKGADELSFKEE